MLVALLLEREALTETIRLAMVCVLKAAARSVGYGFIGLYHYLKKQPTRLYEYIRYQIQLERDDQREAEIRFQNLKQNGRI